MEADAAAAKKDIENMLNAMGQQVKRFGPFSDGIQGAGGASEGDDDDYKAWAGTVSKNKSAKRAKAKATPPAAMVAKESPDDRKSLQFPGTTAAHGKLYHNSRIYTEVSRRRWRVTLGKGKEKKYCRNNKTPREVWMLLVTDLHACYGTNK